MDMGDGGGSAAAEADVWGEIERLLYDNETTTPSSPVTVAAQARQSGLGVPRQSGLAVDGARLMHSQEPLTIAGSARITHEEARCAAAWQPTPAVSLDVDAAAESRPPDPADIELDPAADIQLENWLQSQQLAATHWFDNENLQLQQTYQSEQLRIKQEHENREAEVKREFELKQQLLLRDYQARKAAAMNAAADAARTPAAARLLPTLAGEDPPDPADIKLDPAADIELENWLQLEQLTATQWLDFENLQLQQTYQSEQLRIKQEHEKREAEVNREFQLKLELLLKDYQARKAAAMNAAADAARAPAPALHQEQQTSTQHPATHPFAGEEYRPPRLPSGGLPTPGSLVRPSAAEDAVDAGLKSLFVQNGLDAVCADVVCRGLKVAFGVECLEDLKHITSQDVNAELPKFVPLKLTLVDQRKVAAIIEGQSTVAGGVTDSTNAASILESRPAAAPAAQWKLPCIEGFFCKINPDKEGLRSTIESVRRAEASDKDEKLKVLEALVSDTVESMDPHKEAQELTELFQRSYRPQEFEVLFHPQPTFQIFSDCMRTAAKRNVRHLLISGHGQSRWGFFWLKEGALEYERIPTEKFVGLFRTEVAGAHGKGTIEGVVLNACDTEGLGKKLRDAGVPHVVCWRSEVYDSTASKFTSDFYTSFKEIKNYKIAFMHAVIRMDSGGGAARGPRRDFTARGAVDYVCLLSADGDEFPDTGHIRGRVEDGGGDTQKLSVEIQKGKLAAIIEGQRTVVGGVTDSTNAASGAGHREAPNGWRWREKSQSTLTKFTPSLQALLLKGEGCPTVVRKKFVDYMQGASPVSSLNTYSMQRPQFERGGDGWVGLRLAALCIGVGAYSGSSRLDNPVRDAEALFEAINNCPDCRAAILRDPPDRSTIFDYLCDEFLEKLKALSADKLPDVVALVLAGHGMQHESNVFLIPAKAKCDSERKLKDNCLSHMTVLECMLDVLDSPARKALKEVKFVLIMDMCRVPGEFALTKMISDPDQNKAPVCWSICYSTSRGTEAADGEPGSHSPLVLGLLDPQSGIFAPGVSLKHGIENACESVEKLSGVDMRQRPINIALNRLGDFALHPAAAEKPQDVSEGAGSADTPASQYDIVAFLKSRGLGRIAERVSEELGIEKSDHLRLVEDEVGQLDWLKHTQLSVCEAKELAIDEPDWLCCPITEEMFRDPVMVPESGTTYEFSTLEKCWAGKKPKDPLSNEELKSTEVITDRNKRREVDSWLQAHPYYAPSGWESRDILPAPKPPRYVTQAAQAGAPDRDDVSPHADQDVQPWWEEPDPKKESDGAAKTQERPQEEHAKRSDCKSLQTLFKSDKASVFVDVHSVERSQAIHLQVEEILDGEVLREAEDFADLISPVFRVVLQGASGGKVPDGRTVDLIVELEDVEHNLNTDSLVFIKKSEEPEGMWCGVSGGIFDLVPSECGKGLLLRGRVATDSFSLWGVAKCHVKVAAHHVGVDTESGHRRKLRFIVYSGAPVGSYPIPRNTCLVRKDPASSGNTFAPMLCGFFMYQHSQEQEEVVLRDGLKFKIQVQGKKNGVVIPSSAVWTPEDEDPIWTYRRSIDSKEVEIDVHDIDLDSELEVKILRQSIGWVNRSRDGIREFTLKRQNFNRNILPREWETCTSLGYWCNLDEYAGPQKSITCGYCLSCKEEPSEMVCVKGLGARIKLGGCCKIIENELMGELSMASSASVVSNVVSSAFAAAMIERPVIGGQKSAQLASTDSTTTREVLNSTPTRDRMRLPRIAGFFCKKTVDKKDLLRRVNASEHVAQAEKEVAEAVEGIDPLKEAQELMNRLQRSRPIFEVDVYAQPSFKSFSDSLLSALERNVRALLFSGHGQSHCGLFWLKDKVSAEYEEIEPDRFVKLFPPVAAGAGGTIECVVLNACETYDIGKKLRKSGVLYVVCWLSEVDDTTATEFVVNFFTALDQSDVTKDMDYKHAFEQAVARMGSGGGAARAPMKHLAAGAVDYVCLLSQDGDEFPDTGHIRGEGDDEESRSVNNDKGKFEMESFRHLGFVLEYNKKSISECIEKHREGQLTASQVRTYGLEEKEQYGRKLLYLLPWAVKKIFDVNGRFGVKSYTDPKLWGDSGPIYDKAQRVDKASLKMAIKSLKDSLAKRPAGGNSGHDFMRERIEECVKALVSCLDKRVRAKQTQLRFDPADGNAYPLDSFLECYGEDEGQRRWDAAGQQPALEEEELAAGFSGHAVT